MQDTESTVQAILNQCCNLKCPVCLACIRVHVQCRQIQIPILIPRFSASRHKECPLFNSAGAYSGGRLQWVDADSRSQMVYQNDFLTPINHLTPTVTL